MLIRMPKTRHRQLVERTLDAGISVGASAARCHAHKSAGWPELFVYP
jgi:hypothetical protein